MLVARAHCYRSNSFAVTSPQLTAQTVRHRDRLPADVVTAFQYYHEPFCVHTHLLSHLSPPLPRAGEILDGLHLLQPRQGPAKGKDLVLAREERVRREALARVGTNDGGVAQALGGLQCEPVGGDADGVELRSLARLAFELEALQIDAPAAAAAVRGGPVEE